MATPARTTTLALAWIGAVVGSTVIGLTAVSAIGDGIVGPGSGSVLSAEDVDARLAAATAPVAPGPGAAPPVGDPTPDPAPPTQDASAAVVIAGRGGTVVARCTDGRTEIVSATPAQGFQLDDDDGPRDRVHFDGEIDDDDADVEVRIDCSSGTPVATERIDVDDD